MVSASPRETSRVPPCNPPCLFRQRLHMSPAIPESAALAGRAPELRPPLPLTHEGPLASLHTQTTRSAPVTQTTPHDPSTFVQPVSEGHHALEVQSTISIDNIGNFYMVCLLISCCLDCKKGTWSYLKRKKWLGHK